MSPKSPKSTRGLVVLLLGGVLLTMVVRAVEGQGTRDPVTHPSPLMLAAGDSGKAKSSNQRTVSSGQRKPPEPGATASYVIFVARTAATYARLEAGLKAAFPTSFVPPEPGVPCKRGQILAFQKEPRTWGRVALPEDIQELLGKTEIYVMTGGGNARYVWGIREGRYYRLPMELNQLVADGGLLWSPDNAPKLFRVYSFFLIAYERMRLDNAFLPNRHTGISPKRLDSLITGKIPLVPAYQVASVKPVLGSDRAATPAGTILALTGVVECDGRLEAAVVKFVAVYGYPVNTFPQDWSIRGRVVPMGFWLRLPTPQGRRGGAGEGPTFSVASSDRVGRNGRNGPRAAFTNLAREKPGSIPAPRI